MDDVQNRFARELADAVAAAVAQSADVERCRERARSAGYHLHLTLDATVGFAPLAGHEPAEAAAGPLVVAEELPGFEVSANDRRFLRSLRIAADEVNLEEAN
jgi:hypothetical protein